jgi:hypothetical protein
MNKRQAKREAYRIAARLLSNYLDVGAPYSNPEESEKDQDRIAAAVEELASSLDFRCRQ